jgi:hypothetical protein
MAALEFVLDLALVASDAAWLPVVPRAPVDPEALGLLMLLPLEAEPVPPLVGGDDPVPLVFPVADDPVLPVADDPVLPVADDPVPSFDPVAEDPVFPVAPLVPVPLVCAIADEAEMRNTAATAAARGVRFMLAPLAQWI